MADPIYELLVPYFDSLDPSQRPMLEDGTTSAYLNRITTLSVSELASTEPASLAQSSQSLLRSIQALSKRSHKSINTSATELSKLSSILPELYKSSEELRSTFPQLESKAAAFAEKYRKHGDSSNAVLDQRRDALLLSRNVDRVSSMLDLPTLLSSAISSGQPVSTSAATATAGSGTVNYASALDLHGHIKRLATLYPDSPLIASISAQAEREMRLLTTNLITNLRGPGIKLAGAMRTIGWLRRVAPELDQQFQPPKFQTGPRGTIGTSFGSGDGALGAVLLACRLASLESMLDALEPLRDLAEQETAHRTDSKKRAARDKDLTAGRQRASTLDESWAGGQQTERYLKRYIEIFREQSFAIVSMYKSIFPSAMPVPDTQADGIGSLPNPKASVQGAQDVLLPLPSPLATFTPHLAEMLFSTLTTYLPNVRDKTARDSLLTQVLYCAGSLGRLGGDFSMMLALLEDDLRDADGASSGEADSTDVDQSAEPEWAEIMKKHRIQASRLELLASGIGAGDRRPSRDSATSPTTISSRS
jgi:hypothetical protein